MPKLVALNNKAHRNILVNQDKIEMVGARERMIPVVLSEFLKLSVQYPIVFTKNAESGKFVCVALLGFDNGENLFWKNDVWDSIYIPLNISRQPFFIGKEPGEESKVVVCIDMESPCVSLEQGQPIFTETGEDTPMFEKAKSHMAQLLEGETITADFIETLLSLDLIMPLSLDITFANDETKHVQGIYSIDEEKLEALDETTIAKLHSKKYLKSLYVMVTSLGHIYSLIQRKNAML